MASRGADPSSIVTGSFPVFDEPIAATPAESVSRPAESRLRAILTSDRLNRAVNFSIAFVALVALSPLLLLIAIAVKVTSRGPIIYRQTRVGVDRRLTGGDRRGWASDGRRGDALETRVPVSTIPRPAARSSSAAEPSGMATGARSGVVAAIAARSMSVARRSRCTSSAR
jgi:hypothetical protein